MQQKIKLSRIIAGRNDRTDWEEEANKRAIADRALSIEAIGLISPISVYPVDPAQNAHGAEFEIIAGECRFRAHQLLVSQGKTAFDEIACYVRDDLTPEMVSKIMFAENNERRALDAIDEANAIKKRMDEFKWNALECAEQLSVSLYFISSRLPLLNLRQDAQELVRKGILPLNYAQTLAKLNGQFQQVALKALGASESGREMNHEQFIAFVRVCHVSTSFLHTMRGVKPCEP